MKPASFRHPGMHAGMGIDTARLEYYLALFFNGRHKSAARAMLYAKMTWARRHNGRSKEYCLEYLGAVEEIKKGGLYRLADCSHK